ncbi:SUMO-activating enzyme subunit 2-like isoform X2 [Ostrea edulis]|uniref:SUMO-activating enzyme subunit 2-like isoform X2 n=1 Tax=Ostrea edulis TaxID=37623 RepID=UPI0024AFFAF2|nr:SUMO-activating enzyme subunit 2-like isoform X2 [Ostrea edulis]
MAASLGVLEEKTSKNILFCKILVVGAGGIGCELLKNLVLTGFQDLVVIDLDTIDVSNLNRQFLFRKEHVGKSKAQVAKASALTFNPNAKIVAHHDSIMSPDYGVDFFRKFDMVMNALDNRAARNHVNRMCLAADIPLIESGTAGYLGQVTVIKKSLTECYECQPKPPQKTFPGCTIRNTPSEPIHCVVWAKHLFNQLFGEEDPDQDVSPDTEDPELTAEAGQTALDQKEKANTAGGIERKSTRAWAMETGYNAKKIFNKLFRDDIKYLLSMETLWKKRRPPVPLDFDNLPHTAMAGNIIPAIATTNAIIAALIVMEGLKILNGKIEECKQIYLNRQPNPRKKLLIPCALDKPSPKCYVCSSKPEVTVVLNTGKITIKTLEDKILKSALGMVAPDVEIDDGKGTILISSEEGETEENNDKFLSEFHIGNGSILKCDDFLQSYELKVIIAHADKLEEDKEFDVVGDLSELQAKPQEEKSADQNGATTDHQDEEDDLMVVEDIDVVKTGTKRKADQDIEEIKAKRTKTSSEENDDIVVL